ncbi:MAG: GNAT family N-acetyltransferase [Candidatus Eremiobacteraeota bacterium]|nr:GNAT family N-acetyltransferase [Candidatus Eremiobacteraeota bacterium]
MRTVTEDDMDEIKRLYYIVYGGNYTLTEVNNTDKMKWAIHDPNYIWLLCENGEKPIASVIFVVEPKYRLGKTFAGVVLPDYRGHRIMKTLIQRGLDYIFNEKDLCDLVYGVVRTFVTKSFHKELDELGLIDMGVFPNVRKINKYETHSLKVLFREEAIEKRKKEPVLIKPANEIYKIVREKLGLEKAKLIEDEYEPPEKFEKFEFFIEKSPDIEWEYYEKRDSGKLLISFFPFHYPEIKLYTKDKKTQVFIHFEKRDGHGDLMGLETDQPSKLADILNSVAEYAESIGIKYLELLLDAYNPEHQKKAHQADFLPCAYFPGLAMDENDKRLDFIVSCRTFVPPNFKEMKLTDGTRAFMRAYYKLYTEKLWEELDRV